jgi:hypothetical protein
MYFEKKLYAPLTLVKSGKWVFHDFCPLKRVRWETRLFRGFLCAKGVKIEELAHEGEGVVGIGLST